MPSIYATPDDVRYSASYEVAASMDPILLRFLESSSRAIDQYTARHFYPWLGIKYINGVSGTRLSLPDVLSISSFVADSENDGTWDGETWVEGTDYYLESLSHVDQFPKAVAITTGWGNYRFCPGDRRYKLTSLWGYGDGQSATPWILSSVTATVATTTGTSVTVSSAGVIVAGQTIRVGTGEMMNVTSVNSTTLTVERGVNGSTATTHSSAAVSVVQYPRLVTQCAVDMCVESFFNRFDITTQVGDVASEGFNFSRNEEIFFRHLRMLNTYRRLEAA